MLDSRIDHLVITAPTVECGVSYVKTLLGVEPCGGGQHPRMGTHNRLLRLGDDIYLEVISIDPQGADPQRPRWFQLDTPPAAGSRLATWVMRVSAIEDAVAASTQDHGTVERMSRGNLNWSITIPADGRLRHHGTVPPLIQWDDAPPYPASRLPDNGCSLQALVLHHHDATALGDMLKKLNFAGPVETVQLPRGVEPYLTARILSPLGIRTLDSRMPQPTP